MRVQNGPERSMWCGGVAVPRVWVGVVRMLVGVRVCGGALGVRWWGSLVVCLDSEYDEVFG